MRTGIEEIVIVEVVETVDFGLLKLKVDECRYSFRLYSQCTDILFEFILFLPELVDVLLVSTTQNHLQLLLLDLLLKFIQFLKV